MTSLGQVSTSRIDATVISRVPIGRICVGRHGTDGHRWLHLKDGEPRFRLQHVQCEPQLIVAAANDSQRRVAAATNFPPLFEPQEFQLHCRRLFADSKGYTLKTRPKCPWMEDQENKDARTRRHQCSSCGESCCFLGRENFPSGVTVPRAILLLRRRTRADSNIQLPFRDPRLRHFWVCCPAVNRRSDFFSFRL